MRILEKWLRNILKYRKQVQIVLSIGYICVIFYLTILSRNQCDSKVFTGLFWEIKHQYWGDIRQNIFLFIPLGICLSEFRFSLVIGISLSIVIEIIQYYFRLVMCQIDDIINNSIGLVIGLIIMGIMSRIYQNIKFFQND